MPRIAILGANGQVGAELCLLLSRMPEVDLVPVCRNPTGSAFLRYSGIACRHGRPAEPMEAPQLIGDCDAIVNCALGSGTPREIRNFDRKLIYNTFRYSRPQATVIHFSTLMAHGDPRPGKLLRGRDAYARAKHAAESRVFAESKRWGKPAYILRLGHVCGPLQNITDKIRKEIASGQVVLPENDLPSNTVYTVTIINAIMAILEGKERPGAFDLTNSPQWTWREVYEYESHVSGHSFSPRIVSGSIGQSLPGRILAAAKRSLGRLASTPIIRRQMEKALALAPSALNDRAQATWFRMRARAEIRALMDVPIPAPELSWIRLDRCSLNSLESTTRLLANNPYDELTADMRNRWPNSLGLFAETPDGELEQARSLS